MTAMDLTKVQSLLDLSERMLVQALSGEWDALGACQDEQGALAKDIFQGVTECSFVEREIITKITDITAQVVTLMERHKAEIADQLKQLRKGGEVNNAYLQHIE